MSEQKSDKRYDVVIYEIESRKIDTIAGVNLKESGQFNSVESRLAIWLPRLNDRYDAVEVEAGLYKKGDVLPL